MRSYAWTASHAPAGEGAVLRRTPPQARLCGRREMQWSLTPRAKCGSFAEAVQTTTAKEVVERYLNYLAEGIANIVNVFRPQAVLIGGGISAEGEALTLPLQKMVDLKILGRGRYAPVVIRAASLGNDAGLAGAAMLAKERK